MFTKAVPFDTWSILHVYIKTLFSVAVDFENLNPPTMDGLDVLLAVSMRLPFLFKYNVKILT